MRGFWGAAFACVGCSFTELPPDPVDAALPHASLARLSSRADGCCLDLDFAQPPEGALSLVLLCDGQAAVEHTLMARGLSALTWTDVPHAAPGTRCTLRLTAHARPGRGQRTRDLGTFVLQADAQGVLRLPTAHEPSR